MLKNKKLNQNYKIQQWAPSSHFLKTTKIARLAKIFIVILFNSTFVFIGVIEAARATVIGEDISTTNLTTTGTTTLGTLNGILKGVNGVVGVTKTGAASITLCSATASDSWYCDYACASADDCQVAFAAAQSAIDALPQGGIIRLSEGDFRVTGVNFTKPKVYLTGAGMDATSITLINNSNREAINVSFASSSVTNWGMSDLTVYGNKTNNASGGCFVSNENVRDVFITNVFLSQCKGVGATINNIWGLNTNNLIIEWGDTHGLVLDSTISGGVNAKIKGGKIIDNDGDAIRVLGHGAIIDGNELSGGTAGKAGIYLNGYDAVIVNNKFTSVTTNNGDVANYGVLVGVDGDYANISNNTFVGTNMVAAVSYATTGAIYNTIANNDMRITTATPIPTTNRDVTTMIMQRTGSLASGNYKINGKVDIEAESSTDLRLNPSALTNVSLFKDKTDFPAGTSGKSLDVWRNNKRVYLAYDGWGFGQLWSDEDLSIGTRDGGTIKFFNWVAGNNIFQVGSAGGTSNTALQLYGTIGGTNRYAQWQVNDSDDYLNLTRSNSAILGMKVSMPSILGGATGQVTTINDVMKLTGRATSPATCDGTAEGQLYYDTANTKEICWCNGTAWNNLTTGSACD